MGKGGIVNRVEPGSIADELGVQPGDRILSIDGTPLNDFIDFQFLSTETDLEIEILTKEGDKIIAEVEKEPYEPLGIEFTETVFDGIRRCKNNCIFCFMRQSPQNMRKSLYLRDDDYRLSFLQGNYITLTNINNKDWQKIIRWRISPLYISVHTTNPALRQAMMCNQSAGAIMEQLRTLASAGIQMHTQIVLCPGINDGEELNRTLDQLASLWPHVQTVAIVPVGLTKHRRSLPRIEPVTKDFARQTIEMVSRKQKKWAQKLGTNFTFLADEFYLMAEQEIPPAEYYEGYPLLEDGIGLVRMFNDDFFEHASILPSTSKVQRKISIVTGQAAAPLIEKIAERLNMVEGICLKVCRCENNFYGPAITVAGLLTGADLLGCKNEIIAGSTVLLPAVMFNKGGFTLDGYSLDEISRALGNEVAIVEIDGKAFIEAVLGEKQERGDNND